MAVKKQTWIRLLGRYTCNHAALIYGIQVHSYVGSKQDNTRQLAWMGYFRLSKCDGSAGQHAGHVNESLKHAGTWKTSQIVGF